MHVTPAAANQAPQIPPPNGIDLGAGVIISEDQARLLYGMACTILQGLARMPTGSIALPEGTAQAFDEWLRDYAANDPSLSDEFELATTSSTRRPYRDRPQITRIRRPA